MRPIAALSLLVLLGAGCASPSVENGTSADEFPSAVEGQPTVGSPSTGSGTDTQTTPDSPFSTPQADKAAAFDSPFTLVPGKAAEVGGELLVKFERITDSRCPKEVRCFWAGELGVELTVTVVNGGESERVFLGETTAKTKTVFLREITLVAVTETGATLSVSGTREAEKQTDGPEELPNP